MRKSVGLLVIMLVMALGACSMAPVKQPTDGGSLLVGRIVYSSQGIKGKASMMNSLANGGIEVVYLHNNKKESVKTSSEGLFPLYIDAGEKVEISKFQIERSLGHVTQTFTYRLDDEVAAIEGRVVNLGTYVWTVVGDDWDLDRQSDSAMTLKEMFAKRYKDSPWLGVVWRNY